MGRAFRSLTPAVLLGAAWLGACSLARPPPAPPPAVPSPPPAPPHHLGVATQSLVTQARALRLRGELTSATATLERALKIEPSNPLLWIELARLALAADDPRRAEGYGRKALALATGDVAARAQASAVVAETLHAQHRDPEAREFEAQPRTQ